ncbi:MAG: nitrogenase molybdenum-iron protein alpha chain [Deferribacterota bacterium]|nr:nitrogenase molybdenum-iron protein alpha chain [Deferribacterota bacterium]
MAIENKNFNETIEKIIEKYPEKTKKDRQKHIKVMVKDERCKDLPKSNRRSRPGVMTIRGCAYAGSKGVVWGPVKDAIHISHGPVGCGQYSWAARRNYFKGTAGIDSFVTMQFTSDFQENDIVFGGDKKLEIIVDEIEKLFPLNKGITIQSECPVGLIGDDIEAVARRKSKEYNKPIIPVRCEGFRGISQSLGHHIANDSIKDNIYEKDNKGSEIKSTKYDIALIGDYNIGGDAWASRKILEDMGLNLISQSTGDSTINEIENLGRAKVVLIHCYRSMNYIARYIEEKFGIPWLEFNFFGPTEIFNSMRHIASFFDDKIKERTEYLINEKYVPITNKIIEEYKPRLKDKTVMLYVGGLRPRHTIPAFRDLGMEVLITGYEFAHNDDYERTKKYLEDATLVVDDMNEYEMENLLKNHKPNMFGSGIKEKYQSQKLGVPFRQMHSWDYSGPYHGIDGFGVFARDMDMTVNGPVWKKIKAPWNKS